MLDSQPLVHNIKLQVTPPSIRYAFCPAIDFCPVPFFELPAHHVSYMSSEQCMYLLAFFRTKCRQCFRSFHFSSIPSRSSVFCAIARKSSKLKLIKD